MDSIANDFMPISYIYANRYGEGKTIVPTSGQALYNNYSNVLGYPALDGTAAYGVDTLRILDILIGQMASARPGDAPAAELPANRSASDVSASIQSYAAEMHDFVTAPSHPYGPPATFGEPGTLFSINA